MIAMRSKSDILNQALARLPAKITMIIMNIAKQDTIELLDTVNGYPFAFAANQ